MHQNITGIEVLEGAISGVMKGDQKRHHFRKTQAAFALSMSVGIGKSLLAQPGFKADSESVYITEQFE